MTAIPDSTVTDRLAEPITDTAELEMLRDRQETSELYWMARKLLEENAELRKHAQRDAGFAVAQCNEMDRLQAKASTFRTERNEALSLVEQLHGQLRELASLQDHIPDDQNGDFGLGWDGGYNAALAEVRTIASEALGLGEGADSER